MSRILIVTADDFGLHEAVNEAVVTAHTQGVLTAASLMVGAPAAADAVRRAHELPDLRVGLHLVLTDGKSLLAPHEIPDLVDAERRFDDRMALSGMRFFALPRVRRQLEAEIRAQFEAFARAGLVLDHVNAHKHFHLHPTILGLIVRVGREFCLRAVRVPAEPLWFAHRAGGSQAVAVNLALSPWTRGMKRRLLAHQLTHNDHLFGLACSGSLHEQRFLEILSRFPRGVTEIYLHPAVLSPQFRGTPGYGHDAELRALLSDHVRDAIASMSAARGGYADAIRMQVR